MGHELPGTLCTSTTTNILAVHLEVYHDQMLYFMQDLLAQNLLGSQNLEF